MIAIVYRSNSIYFRLYTDREDTPSFVIQYVLSIIRETLLQKSSSFLSLYMDFSSAKKQALKIVGRNLKCPKFFHILFYRNAVLFLTYICAYSILPSKFFSVAHPSLPQIFD